VASRLHALPRSVIHRPPRTPLHLHPNTQSGADPCPCAAPFCPNLALACCRALAPRAARDLWRAALASAQVARITTNPARRSTLPLASSSSSICATIGSATTRNRDSSPAKRWCRPTCPRLAVSSPPSYGGAA